MLSAVILTKNEEKNIIECIRSLSFCDEIIIVDDYSSDKTINLIQNFNSIIKIYKRNLSGNFAQQRNFGLEKAKGEWVLFLDADERISVDLKTEIINEITSINNPYSGYFLKRTDFLFGKKLNFGETSKIRLLRLARKDVGKWKRRVHEIWDIKGRTKILKNPLTHFAHSSLNQFISEINYHTDLDVKSKIDENKKALIFFEILSEVGSGISTGGGYGDSEMSPGFGFRAEKTSYKSGGREGTIEEQNVLFGKKYEYSFDYKKIREAIKTIAEKFGYGFEITLRESSII